MLSHIQHCGGSRGAQCKYAQTIYTACTCGGRVRCSPVAPRTSCRLGISRDQTRPINSGSWRRPPTPPNRPSQPPAGRPYRTQSVGSIDLRSVLSELRQIWQRIPLEQVKQDPITGVCLNPQPGRLGRSVRLLTNHYAISLSTAFHSVNKYTVSITRKGATVPATTTPLTGSQNSAAAIPLEVRQKVILELATVQSWRSDSWQYDPSSNRLFSQDVLTPGSVNIQLPGTGGQQGKQAGTQPSTTEFQVTVSQTQQLTTPDGTPGSSDLLDLLNLLLKATLLAALPKQAVQTARSFLLGPAATTTASPAAGRGGGRGGQGARRGGRGGPAAGGGGGRGPSAGSGLQLWEGIRSAVRLSAALQPGKSRLDVQLDHTAGGVIPVGPLSDQLMVPGTASPADLCGNTRLCKQAEDLVRGVKIQTSYLPGAPQSRRVKGLDHRSPEKYTFDMNGSTTTVAQYFRSTYPNLKLKHLHDWPCVMVGKKAAVPLELCRIAEPQSRTVVNARQVADLIRVAALPPGVRLKRLRDTMQGLLNQFKQSLLQMWGVTIKPEPLQVPGRVLPDAKLQFADSRCADVANKGQWRAQPFVRPAALQRWAVLNLAGTGYQTGVDAFVDELCKQLRQQGVTGSRPAVVHRQASAVQAGVEAATAAAGATATDLQLLIVVLPDDKGELYNEIKETAGAKGIVTQCLVAAHAGIPAASRGQGGVRAPYVGNLVLKVNQKLGGINWQLPEGPEVWAAKLNTKQLMLLGIDVGHGMAGGGGKKPSTAAVTGSLDRGCSRYGAFVMQQTAGEEIVLGLQEAVQQLLRDRYAAMTGVRAVPSGLLPRESLPDSLLVYRDGVSDSQYTAVLQEEVTGIRRACEVVGGPQYEPKVTFIVVSRSHGTRLFPHPDDPNSSDQSVGGKSGNVVPGTVVDQLITAPVKYEFFLNSHAGIQGTNRPGRFNVLVDDNCLGQDGLQLITMHLSSLYCACTRTISSPAPCRYADKAASTAAGAPGSAGGWITMQAASPGIKAREYRVLDISKTLAGKMWFA